MMEYNSYLDAKEVTKICKDTSNILKNDIFSLQNLRQQINLFLQDELLISNLINSAKIYFSSYIIVLDAMILANELDIIDYFILEQTVGEEILDGCFILTNKEKAKRSREYYDNIACYYEQMATNSFAINNAISIYFFSLAEQYRKLSQTEHELYMLLLLKEQKYDSIELNTKDLFRYSKLLREEADQILKGMHSQYINKKYICTNGIIQNEEINSCIKSRQEIIDIARKEGIILLYRYLENKNMYTDEEINIIIQDIKKEDPYCFVQLWILNRKDTYSCDLLLEQIDKKVNNYNFIHIPSEIKGVVNGKSITLNPNESWAIVGGGNYGSSLNMEDGHYVVAVGPKILDPNYSDEGKIWKTDFSLPRVIKISLVHKETGEQRIIKCLVKDIKAHTYNTYPTDAHPDHNRTEDKAFFDIENGVIQTGIAYPNSYNAEYGVQFAPQNIDGSVVEFCGGQVDFEIDDYRLDCIVLVEEE